MSKNDVKAVYVMVFIVAQVIVFFVSAFLAVFFSSVLNVGLMLFFLCSMLAWSFVLDDLSADDNLLMDDELLEKRLEAIQS